MTEKTKKHEIYKNSYKIGLIQLREEIDKIERKELRELLQRFHDNIDTLFKMILFPVILCSEEFMGFNYLLLILEARLSSNIINWEEANEEDKKRYLEEEKRLWETKYKPKEKQLALDALNQGETKFKSMLERPDIHKSYMSLLYSAIVFIWCNFEMLMKDLWETFLNMAGKRIKKFALDNIDKMDSATSFGVMRGKYISIDYLGQYDYNVKNKLGSILVNKFDFTSPYGIKSAYKCAFPKSPTIKGYLELDELVQLEARRSVIVHRAGIIDKDFCKKTKVNIKEIGNSLQLNDEEVLNYANVTIVIALQVMEAISQILFNKTSKNRAS